MKNAVGKIIRTIGYILLGFGVLSGIISGIIVAKEVNGFMGFVAFIASVLSVFISFVIFLGFSEIIFLLQENNDMLKKSNEKENEPIPQTSFKVKTVEEMNISKEQNEMRADEDYEDFECPYCYETLSVSKSTVDSGKIECPYCDETIILEK